MQFEINHSQQTAAFTAVDTFSQTEKSLFSALEANLTSEMARSYGSYKTAFTKVLLDVRDTENQINALLVLMRDKMTEVRNTYQAHDETGQTLNTSVQSRNAGNFSYGIW
jgi:hypothetical protein